MTYGHLRADCLYTGISSGPNARYRVWESIYLLPFTTLLWCRLLPLHYNADVQPRPTLLDCHVALNPGDGITSGGLYDHPSYVIPRTSASSWTITDPAAMCLRAGIGCQVGVLVPDVEITLIMAALWNRAGHYIFALLFLSSSFFFFSSPNLSGRRLDVYHTSAHGVALVRI